MSKIIDIGNNLLPPTLASDVMLYRRPDTSATSLYGQQAVLFIIAKVLLRRWLVQQGHRTLFDNVQRPWLTATAAGTQMLKGTQI